MAMAASTTPLGIDCAPGDAGLVALTGAYAVYGAFWGAWAVVLVEYLDVRDLSLAAIGGLFPVTSVTAIATMTFGGAPAVRLPRPQALAAAFALAGAHDRGRR